MSIGTKVVTLSLAESLINEVIVDLLNSVVATMGPKGNTVITANTYNEVPHVTKDGVTVSESISYNDPLKASIVNLIKEAARKTSMEVGDGTTTAILLTVSLLSDVLSRKANTTNFRSVIEGMEKAVDFIIEYLQEEVVYTAINSEELKKVIHTSSNSDPTITELLTKVTSEIGEHGIIDVKLADKEETYVDIKSGAVLESRAVVYPGSPDTVNLGESLVLLVEGPLDNFNQLKPILNTPLVTASPIVIIAKEFSKELIEIINVNNQRKARRIALIEAEGFANSRLKILEDLALVTGAEIYSTSGATAKLLSDFDVSGLGRCMDVSISGNEIVLNYNRDILLSDTKITAKVEELTKTYKQLEKEAEVSVTRSGEFNVLKKQLSKYVSVAIINVGGTTRAQAVEIKDRIDDSVAAISAAVNSGILPGGGSAFVRAVRILEKRRDQFVNDEEWIGAECIKAACLQPIYTLSANSGTVFDDTLLSKIEADERASYDVITQKVVDAYDVGILDPALVAINALNNALAVTKSIANSNSIIVQEIWPGTEDELSLGKSTYMETP